ncbi:post-GPI attachment to proteins factor 6-like [Trichoplusia ni]|uniref:Post-GPI attachment to proteins factor 6-like n=1 Tax=Trichoplusia ni TaxID=7111 RepID=A0A7E5WSJ8_TRINI|nr:post-GPI attachment to proteins factor 6-like [Trichoplusia ni]
MRVCLNFVILFVCIAYIFGDKEAEEDANRKRIIEQLTRTRTVLLDDYHLVTRQIATDVYMYRNYRTVSVVFYPIMRDVTEARFTFQSEELHLNNIGSCDPQEVIINIKHGSYPAVNPDGYGFPKDFIDPATREPVHTQELLSDGKNRTYTIENPKPGNWYALIYIKWEDPRTQKVEQQGLVANCQTILYTDLQVQREENVELIDCYTGITELNYDELPAYFKCMTLDNVDPISLNVTIVNTTASDKELFVRVQALSFPTEENYLIYCAFNPKGNNIQTITFIPNPNAWHYIHIGEATGNVTRIADCESYFTRSDVDELINHTVIDLMRDDKGRFFTFDYGLPTTDLQDATSLVNITSSEIKSLRFKVNQFLDIGGSLTIASSLLMSLKYYMGYRREFAKDALLAFTEDNQFFKAVICMDIGHASIPLESGHCRYNDKVKPALFVLNSTDSESIYDKTFIPYPDSGHWYLTFRIFCDQVVCPCRTSDNGTKYYVDTSADKDGEGGVLEGNDTRVGTSECNATIVLTVSSMSCVGGKCSNHGSCLLNTFGGLVMSFCSCSAGYGGWDCSDNSRMDSRVYMLVSILLLTLSNLLFFFSIYVAVIRTYYTEAMMYTFTMIFSTFYHACDAPSQVAYCIVKGNILQFGDFYCGLMSFWVTLLAMSIIGDKFRSSLQLIGAIIIALLTTWNMHSIVSFLLPVAVGVGVLLLSWYLDFRKIRSLRYPRTYYIRYLPLGIILVSIGLICYAFLQTEQNYKIVHSIWHMIIALSVVFLLPDVKRGSDVNAFLPSQDYFKLSFRKVFQRSHRPTAVD